MKFKSEVYKSAEGKKILQDLYLAHLETIKVRYEEHTVNTRFGQTHLLVYGNPEGKPVLGFHGGNATNPFSLRAFVHHLDLEKIKLIVPDTIGNIGFSAERRLSSKSFEYGEWASDIMDALGLKKVTIFGGSYGAGIALRLCSYAPKRIERVLLVVPSGICNASKFNMIKIAIPILTYLVKPNDKKLQKAVFSLTPFQHDEFLEMTKAAITNSKFEMVMPRNATKSELERLDAPVLIFAEKDDVLFPGQAVIDTAKKIIPNLIGTYLLELGSHGGFFKDENTHFEYYDIMSEFLLQS